LPASHRTVECTSNGLAANVLSAANCSGSETLPLSNVLTQQKLVLLEAPVSQKISYCVCLDFSFAIIQQTSSRNPANSFKAILVINLKHSW
jgi:hypothetical protein